MNPIPDTAIKTIFTEARTHKAWLDKPVSDEVLHNIFDVSKWGPTSANSVPARFLFVKSKEAKEKLLPAIADGNKSSVQTAPVTVIIAQDEKFFEHMAYLFPHFDAKSMFANNEALAKESAFRNSTLQGAYFILAARALGLDCGPMSGFDNALVDKSFFEDTSWKSNFICTIGYGDASKLWPRGPRLSFDQSAQII